MKRKIGLGLAGLAGLAVAALATALPAQEKPEGEMREHREMPRAMARAFGGSGSWLGVGLDEVDRAAAERLGIGEPRGARIADVIEESPAAAAGLEEDDVIVSWNDARVESAIQLRRLVRETPAGRTVRIGVLRDGRERELQVTLGERERHMSFGPPGIAMAPHAERLRRHMERIPRGGEGFHVFVGAGHGRLGVAMQSLGEQLGAYFGVEGGAGALVASVREESPAAKAGLRAGDVIVRIGDADVEDAGDAARAVREAEAGPISIEIVRDKRRQTLTADLPERQEGMRMRVPGAEGRAFYFEAPTFELQEFELPGMFEFPEVRGFDLPDIPFPEFDEPVAAPAPAAPPVPPLPLALI